MFSRPRFSETARQALQDVKYTFFLNKIQIYQSYYELPINLKDNPDLQLLSNV